jgi:hypothetical protein
MTGPSSVAPMGRRLVALIVDWVLCYVIASGIVRHSILTVTDAHYQDAQLVALLLFALEVYLLTAVSGCSACARSARTAAVPASAGPRCAPSSCCASSRPACPTATCAACTTAPPTRSLSGCKTKRERP